MSILHAHVELISVVTVLLVSMIHPGRNQDLYLDGFASRVAYPHSSQGLGLREIRSLEASVLLSVSLVHC